jgi:hypothetical protein
MSDYAQQLTVTENTTYRHPLEERSIIVEEISMTDSGKDGVYRMTIDSRYKQLAGVRRDSKLLACLGVSVVDSCQLPVGSRPF